MGEQDMPTGPASDTESGAVGDATAGGTAAGGTAAGGTAAGGAAERPAAGPGNGPSSSPGKRRLGVMGGTFDPIHHGHLVAASEVAAQFHLDEVVFVPTGQPWQKTDRSVTPAEDRYLMTVIATAENPQFSVSRIDIDRGGPTYTTDTLRDLRALNPDADLFFITGADALGQILTWRYTEELFSLAHFIGVTRPGHTLTDPGLPEGGVSLVEVPALAISSTDCRARVAKGDPVWYLVPDGVVRYIDKRELYRGQ
ncbi:nicotinate-nucleotide adenylyltransferase [Streptomyces sp. NPDC051920]|uniref:nicotinate-nucleotide adenylyltransferase n=2 Tax=unclassified Streptomyces TaxID=2593676 RepID=UPI003412E5D8